MRHLLLLVLMLSCGAEAATKECGATAEGVLLRHQITTSKTGTHAICSADKATGAAQYGSRDKNAPFALCSAGEWVFAYVPETDTSTATRAGRRVELFCALPPA